MDAWTHAGHPSAPRSCTGAETRRPPEPLEPEAEAREARAEEPEDAEGAEPGAVRAEAEARAEALWTAPSAQSSAQQSPELLARPLRPATPPSERQLGAEARDDESRFRFAEFRCALERRWTWERRSASPRRGPIRPSAPPAVTAVDILLRPYSSQAIPDRQFQWFSELLHTK